jgi:hypothetical protein
VVVAIIAILAAVALPQYQNYVAKAKTAAALAEITPGKSRRGNDLRRGRRARHHPGRPRPASDHTSLHQHHPGDGNKRRGDADLRDGGCRNAFH